MDRHALKTGDEIGVGQARIWFEQGRGSVVFCELTEARSREGMCAVLADTLHPEDTFGGCVVDQ